MSEVLFPRMSDDVTQVGVLSTWYVVDGETVVSGQLLADAAMDKVDAEVVSPAAGIITLAVGEGAELAQDSVIATIDDA